jgi:hypothetical protein
MSTTPFSRSAIESLVMDYLVVEGYRDAAAAFAAEGGPKPTADLDSVAGRMQVCVQGEMSKKKQWVCGVV